MGSLCKAVPVCFPHEMLGYPRESAYGTLLSIEILNKVYQDEEKYAKTNKSKQGKRMAKAPRRPPRKR